MVLNGVHASLEPATLWTEPAAQKPTDNPGTVVCIKMLRNDNLLIDYNLHSN